jgi:hypothetical protein
MIYRAYVLTIEGRVLEYQEFDCETDEEAVRLASELIGEVLSRFGWVSEGLPGLPPTTTHDRSPAGSIAKYQCAVRFHEHMVVRAPTERSKEGDACRGPDAPPPGPRLNLPCVGMAYCKGVARQLATERRAKLRLEDVHLEMCSLSQAISAINPHCRNLSQVPPGGSASVAV